MSVARELDVEPDEADEVATDDGPLSQAVNASACADTDEPGPSILEIEVEVRFVLGRADLDVGRLMALTDGDVLPMDRGPSDPVDVMVNGTRIAQGELVEGEAGMGVRVTRLCAPDRRGERRRA